MTHTHDVTVVRELAAQYRQAAAKPVQDERRQLWTRHTNLQPTRPLVLVSFGMWNVWCREVFGDHALQCADPFFRQHERALRLLLFQDSIGDDTIVEPWYTLRAAVHGGWNNLWGVELGRTAPEMEGGAWKFDPPLKTWDDVRLLRAPRHVIDEAKTREAYERLAEAIGDLLPIHVARHPVCINFKADISTDLARLRGLEQVMLDMYEAPEELHRLLAFMRDGILANQAEAEQAGDWSLADGYNQAMAYGGGLPAPQAGAYGARRAQLWGFFAAQEFTLISPAMHEEFLLRYQLPIMQQFGRVAYGCCEDLTRKIDMLRHVPNLRIIAVTPRADVRRCAEQIGTEYVISWRPNPTDMVCCGFDEARIEQIVRAGLEACRGCHMHLHLKDIETVEGDPSRLARWVRIVRRVADKVW